MRALSTHKIDTKRGVASRVSHRNSVRQLFLSTHSLTFLAALLLAKLNTSNDQTSRRTLKELQNKDNKTTARK